MMEGTSTFGDLLRRYRLAAGLTQDELAERSQLSPRAISDLERGRRTRPWRDTIQLLATALGLDPSERVELETAARRGGAPPAAVPSPAAPPLQRSPTNLPIPTTSFVGREREIAEVRQRLTKTRLLTLTGTGGCGKTRLALQVASTLVHAYPDGVWLVELAPLADASLVAQTVLNGLNVREVPGQDPTATLVTALRARTLFLILDNCEHLVEACARLVEAVLRACPAVLFVATSRELLGVPGEIVYRVPSLPVPGEVARPTAANVQESEAVRLFVDRAATTAPAFHLTDTNAPAIAQIVRRLDGIPLAIELAAAYALNTDANTKFCVRAGPL